MEENLDPKLFGVSPKLFKEWREPRFGNANPQKLTSKVWEWLVHSKLSGYGAAKMVLGSPPLGGGPTWSFERFGQSVTELPDDRMVYIGGEHEDFYDPDFNIYNDVVVTRPDGAVDFYCYRKSDFPPTDFHTATLAGEKIIIIGGLGYKEERIPEYTQLYALELGNFEIRKLESSGTAPGWIHNHMSVLSENRKSIVVTGGKIFTGKVQVLKENIDDWKLSLDDWHWERLTKRNWTQFEIRRKDHGGLHLILIRMALRNLRLDQDDQYQDMMSNLSELLGHRPDVQRIEDLYDVEIEHTDLRRDENTYNRFYFDIEGVRVRLTEEQFSLQVVIEGRLSDEQESLIKEQLIDKVSTLVNSPCEVEEYENRE